MRLLDEALLRRFAEVGRQEGKKDPLVIAMYCEYFSMATWFATEYYPENREFFGYVSIFGDHNDEWGYFSLADLVNVEADRVMFFEPIPASQIIPGFKGFSK